MHTQHESTEHRLSRNKILIINSNDNTQSGHSENGLTFKCDYLESLCLRCKDVCDGTKFSRRYIHIISLGPYFWNLGKRMGIFAYLFYPSHVSRCKCIVIGLQCFVLFKMANKPFWISPRWGRFEALPITLVILCIKLDSMYSGTSL